MKPYYYYTKKTNISYPETTNNLAENPTNKHINEKICIPFDYLEFESSCQQKQSWKSHFINNFIDITADIFISNKECANYELALKLRYDGIMFFWKSF